MTNSHYDAIIIGFGKGGKTLGGKLAKAGKSVALIEKDAFMYGGTCINVGCIPSKSLIHSAAQVNPAASFPEKSRLYQEAIKEKRRLTAMLREKNYKNLASFSNVTIYNGKARFIAPQQVEVKTAEGCKQISGEQIFINTGATPRIPAIKGVETTPGVYTSAELMDLDKLPKSLIIIGGGYIGLEFAAMYNSFGSKVTILQDKAEFLPQEDQDIATEIKSLLTASGIDIRLGVELREIQAGPTAVYQWQGQEHRLQADAILLATGRIPNTAELNCPAAGIDLTDRGAVKVDDKLRASAPQVWAMGDVTGGQQHTYISLDDSRIVWQQLVNAGKEYTTLKRKNVPYSVFLSVPYSRVGLNEQEAKAAGYTVKVSKLPTAAIPKAQVLKATSGILKAIIDAKSHKILGAMLLCAESYETINVIKLAMDLGADYTVLQDQVFTHPTMTEALNDLFTI